MAHQDGYPSVTDGNAGVRWVDTVFVKRLKFNYRVNGLQRGKTHFSSFVDAKLIKNFIYL